MDFTEAMTGNLEHIYSNLQEKELDRTQIIAYVRYLDELIRNGLTMEKELAYQGIKLRLFRRMNALNEQQIKFYPKNQKSNDEK